MYKRQEVNIVKEIFMIQSYIKELVQYGLNTGLVEKEDTVYTVNALLEFFGLDEYEGELPEAKEGGCLLYTSRYV